MLAPDVGGGRDRIRPHRTPLQTWFGAVWFVTAQKNGVSVLGLQRVLGLSSYETAWTWMHKLRRAMVRPDRELLSGLVEVDESFIFGTFHQGISREQLAYYLDEFTFRFNRLNDDHARTLLPLTRVD